MAERPVCPWCGQETVWNAHVWGWVCPAGEVVSEHTGQIIGSIGTSRQPSARWRQPGQPWPEDADG